MNHPIAERLPVSLKFSFPAIFQGRGIIVTVDRHGEGYEICVDDNVFARVKLEPDINLWRVVNGELNDADLLKEIGDRIEARCF